MSGPRLASFHQGQPSRELRIGPMTDDQYLDPQDVDARGDIALAATTGSAPDVLNLMELNAAYYIDLAPQLVKKPDAERTRAIEEDGSGELLGLINAEVDPDDGQVISATVRGDTPSQRVITYIVEHESGRTRKGFLPYGEVPEVEEAYQANKDRADGVAAPVVPAGDPETAAQLSRLLERLDEQDKRIEAAEERAKAAEARAADPEPWPGYDELSVTKIEEHLKGVESYGEREGLKARVREYEPRHENRSGAIKAAEPEDPPAPPAPEG